MGDPLTSYPGYLLRRASAASLATLNGQLEELGINHADAALLLAIHANPGATQSEIGRLLGVQRANMVPLMARNDRRGWLRREQMDGRSQGLFLSPDGEAARRGARAIIERYEGQLIERVPADLRAHVIPILRYLWGEGRE